MIKITLNEVLEYENVLDSIASDITGNNNLKNSIITKRADLLNAGNAYTQNSKGNLHSIKPSPANLSDATEVVQGITKANLNSLYETYLRGDQKESRYFYDLLMMPGTKCPYCGGNGEIENLDHFLPKVHFPQFAIFPYNLVPSCLRCNQGGDKAAFPKFPGEQFIHPYLDDDKFFKEQWVDATLHDEPYLCLEFFFNAPGEWNEDEKNRAMYHFIEFDIAKTYGSLSSVLIGGLWGGWIKHRDSGLDVDSFVYSVLEPFKKEATFVNHWISVLCHAFIRKLKS